MKKNKLNSNITFISISLIRIICFVAGVIYLMTVVLNANQYDDDGSIIPLSVTQKSFVYFAFIASSLALLLITASFFLFFIFDSENKIKLLAFSFLSLSPEGIIYAIILGLKEGWYVKNINGYKPKGWTVFDITAIGLLLALFLLIDFISGLVPTLPFWITISLKYIVLFFGAFSLPILGSLTLCILAASLTVIMPGTAINTFPQYFFDYWLPTTSFFVAGFFKPNTKVKNKYYEIFSWVIFVSAPIFILYISRIIAGVIYWLNPSALGEEPWYSFIWEGMWGYSAIYNSFNTITDFVTLQIIVPPICKGLEFIKERYFDKNTEKNEEVVLEVEKEINSTSESNKV
ncbi:hypothetical protein SHELI_v1c02340 [Spiroplasma helicoides]|uniref:Thiamine transporter n=1 Tax=Spiroplasma helicoides TaxID=216938 RepID=A0A1B3SJT0_9MOLU|nr:energy-coupled thiamine transporter ThiT [Spiroplasma helicoides]AOG60189.1 hypothetical protein SHELI_v1c02340 [Spiroplasma helicoides]